MAAPAPPLLNAQDLYDSASCGLLVADSDGVIRRINRTFCDWIGYSAAELVDNKRFSKLLTMGGQIFLQTHFTPLMQIQRSVAEVKFDFVHSNGSTVPMLVNCARRRYGDQDFDEVSALLVRDREKYEREILVARRKAEELSEKLSSADQKKDEFLAMLAHELRNPLAPMRNVVEILRKKDIVDPQIAWSRDVLERQIASMNHLVDDLLEASRIVQGKIELRLKPVELTELLKHSVEAARPTIEGAGHDLTIHFPGEPVWFEGDPTRLVQIVVNLLNNAAKFTPDAGKIVLSGNKEEDEIVLSVSDNGVGIAQSKLTEIFEMFSQLSSTRETTQGGLGIGLALVRVLAELHNGTVSADSKGAGSGSVFTVRFPIVDPHQPELSEVSAATDGRPLELKMLVVDDDHDSASSTAMLFQLGGHQVETAADGLEALLKAEDFRPDAMLLDIGLPDMTGYELARQIRLQPWGKDVLLLAITGWGQAADKGRATGAGFDHHFTKPINVTELERALSDFSSRKKFGAI